jgi:hypothetical protein
MLLEDSRERHRAAGDSSGLRSLSGVAVLRCCARRNLSTSWDRAYTGVCAFIGTASAHPRSKQSTYVANKPPGSTRWRCSTGAYAAAIPWTGRAPVIGDDDLDLLHVGHDRGYLVSSNTSSRSTSARSRVALSSPAR